MPSVGKPRISKPRFSKHGRPLATGLGEKRRLDDGRGGGDPGAAGGVSLETGHRDRRQDLGGSGRGRLPASSGLQPARVESINLGFTVMPLDYEYAIYPAGFASFLGLILGSLADPGLTRREVEAVLFWLER